jgi:UDP-N-acetylglucosamine--N-acetylmuramyl-(pentapeptide) pyrophosphoryl-undecaprenol N-acetylglucosamine transferase
VSELAIAGVPSILVPYHVGNGEQHRNARYLVDAGAALVVNQEDVTSAYIDSVVLPLLDDGDRRQEMGRAAKRVAVTDAAERFAAMVWRAGGSV